MVETRVDPIRPPTINLSDKELDDIQALINAGDLPGDFLERYFDAVDANVFGHDAPKDRHGNRKEQGIGSAGNQTANSLAAYIKFHGPNGPQPDPPEIYDAAIKRMRAELAECDAKREETSVRSRYLRKGKRKVA